jgi:hypothetical protein
MGMRVPRVLCCETRYFKGFASLSPGRLRAMIAMRVTAVRPAQRIVAY